MTTVSGYTSEHALELEQLLASPQWRRAIDSGLVEQARAGTIKPGRTRGFIDTVVDQLVALNGGRVDELIAAGCRDAGRLLDALATWPHGLGGKDPRITFLGINLTSCCNFTPRCIYCNQPAVDDKVGLDGWKRVIDEATRGITPGGDGPYIYLTGGEPLLLGEAVWGDGGIVRYATERGAGVNVNTNAAALSPEVALRLVKAGTAKLHVSFDTPDRALQNILCSGDRFDRILEGIYNVQIARDLAGTSYPVIHTNCVLTNRNLDTFPQLFGFILDKHRQTATREDPFFNDLFPHVIPVGGEGNAGLRPSEAEFRRFYEKVWPDVCSMWDAFQARLGVEKEKRGALFGYFSNPFLRVEHKGGLDAYARTSADGRYGRLALCRRCYVAPTQAAFTPDGLQFRCGCHAIRRILPVGNIREGGMFDSIRAGVEGLASLPAEEHCDGCALATLYINQSVEQKLKGYVDQRLKQQSEQPEAGAGRNAGDKA